MTTHIQKLGDGLGLILPSAIAEQTGLAAGSAVEVTAENAMKFDATQPGPTTFTFGQADSIVTFALAHNMVVRGHTLVWYNQVPRWVTTGNLVQSSKPGMSKRTAP